jgi:hypothetical protein
VVNNSAQRFAGCVRDAHALGLAGPPFLLGFQRLRFPNPIGTGKSSKIVPPMATTWSSSLRPANNVHAARSGQESLAEVIYAPKGVLRSPICGAKCPLISNISNLLGERTGKFSDLHSHKCPNSRDSRRSLKKVGSRADSRRWSSISGGEVG